MTYIGFVVRTGQSWNAIEHLGDFELMIIITMMLCNSDTVWCVIMTWCSETTKRISMTQWHVCIMYAHLHILSGQSRKTILPVSALYGMAMPSTKIIPRDDKKGSMLSQRGWATRNSFTFQEALYIPSSALLRTPGRFRSLSFICLCFQHIVITFHMPSEFRAMQVDVEASRVAAAHQCCLPLDSPFRNLLRGCGSGG